MSGGLLLVSIYQVKAQEELIHMGDIDIMNLES